MIDRRLNQAIDLMARFMVDTGLTGDRPARRYLWTDAFAVTNLLKLHRRTGDRQYRELALALVDQVHYVLGRHRGDDGRAGWLSGLVAGDAEAHPTSGGLRIGKPLPERTPTDPIDERLEWDRDGQYFHYLTKWMLALDRVARATRQPAFNVWARELAAVAHRTFVRATPGGTRMYWKMSIDLSRPLVAAMGQHDPIDGWITCVELDVTTCDLAAAPRPSLALAAADFGAMAPRQQLATTDPLGLGGLLVDASRVASLMRRGAWPGPRELLDELLEAAVVGLAGYCASAELGAPAAQRLAFRELGLAIGLAAAHSWASHAQSGDRFPGSVVARDALRECGRYASLRGDIESFWLEPVHRSAPAWLAHADINGVMLATALLSGAFPASAGG